MECLQYLKKGGMYYEIIRCVLNLVINGMPSILLQDMSEILASLVLNLVINGMPSILERATDTKNIRLSFKPCYKWNAFNT